MKLLSRSRSRVMAEVTAPPPTAITALVSSSRRAITRSSSALKVPSPSSRKIAPIGLVASDSISTSASKNRQPSRSARRMPVVVLPAPMNPISTRFR